MSGSGNSVAAELLEELAIPGKYAQRETGSIHLNNMLSNLSTKTSVADMWHLKITNK